MTRLSSWIAFIAALGLASSLHAEGELGFFIEQTIARAPFDNAVWGIDIERENGEKIFQHNAERLMTPASNRKLFTTAYVLGCYDFNSHFSTPVDLVGTVENGVLHGDVVLRGNGDPAFGGRDDPFATASLLPIVEALQRRGIHRVEGAVVADVSLFAADTIPPDWKIGYLSDDYAAPVDALAFNENVIGVTTVTEGCEAPQVTTDPTFVRDHLSIRCGSARRMNYSADATNRLEVDASLIRKATRQRDGELIAVHDPALFAASALRDAMRRAGIESREARMSREPVERGERLVSIDSPIVASILGVVLEASQNLYTEMLLKRVAATERGGVTTSLDDALAGERSYLTQGPGLDPRGFDFHDGCGLASDNLVTPASLVRIVRWLSRPEQRWAFLPLLAEPGDDGTLRKRLKELHGRVYAKTGSINSVAALSGVVVAKDGTLIDFSIVANHFNVPATQVREAIDAIVRKIAETY